MKNPLIGTWSLTRFYEKDASEKSNLVVPSCTGTFIMEFREDGKYREQEDGKSEFTADYSYSPAEGTLHIDRTGYPTDGILGARCSETFTVRILNDKEIQLDFVEESEQSGDSLFQQLIIKCI